MYKIFSQLGQNIFLDNYLGEIKTVKLCHMGSKAKSQAQRKSLGTLWMFVFMMFIQSWKTLLEIYEIKPSRLTITSNLVTILFNKVFNGQWYPGEQYSAIMVILCSVVIICCSFIWTLNWESLLSSLLVWSLNIFA